MISNIVTRVTQLELAKWRSERRSINVYDLSIPIRDINPEIIVLARIPSEIIDKRFIEKHLIAVNGSFSRCLIDVCEEARNKQNR